jgi:hypothetical protein
VEPTDVLIEEDHRHQVDGMTHRIGTDRLHTPIPEKIG